MEFQMECNISYIEYYNICNIDIVSKIFRDLSYIVDRKISCFIWSINKRVWYG